MFPLKQFPKNITFCYPWRTYQKEVLKNLDRHLENQHLHLVAPPGSGKTVLGLEVMLRLNQPTLIVAPTIAIRNQWVSRFTELFLQTETTPDWITTDLRNPKFMTVTTYQGLHALFQDKETPGNGQAIDDYTGEDETFGTIEKTQAREQFFEQNFQTLILDEAHHLRTSWWKTVMSVKKKLNNPAIVALTATPPYDVEKSEWDKYIELCGPIDEEISVAALVKEGDLCPHQDYIWFSKPTKNEKKPIETFHREAKQIKETLLTNKDFIKLIESHPWMQSNDYVEEKLANYRYFISMILFLKELGNNTWHGPFQLIDENPKQLPAFTLEWVEELLTGLLYHDQYVDSKEEPIKTIRKQLSNIGALEHRRVKLIATKAMTRMLLQSASKLDSIVDIVTIEKQAQKEALRLVILADYIYAGDLPKKSSAEQPLIRLGVIPIFEKLRRELKVDCSLGVLTGSIVILPNEAAENLKEYDLDFQINPLHHDERFVKVQTNHSSRQHMVRIITELFSQGKIDVLVGTTALLGEGWDAPSVNTLILASYVGSFMLTNQMRGRAIRTEKGNPGKAANIWHLVCIDEYSFDGGFDFSSIKRRFRSLTGLDEELPIISTGIERLRLPDVKFIRKNIGTINQKMRLRALNRGQLFHRWQEAVQQGENQREELQTVRDTVPRPFIFHHTLKSLLITIASIFISIFYSTLEQGKYYPQEQVLLGLRFGLILGVILSFPFWWKALKIFLFNMSIESSMRQVGNAIYHTLYQIGLIQTPPKQNKLYTKKNEFGHVICYLDQGTTHEQKLFLQCIQEIVEPIENPRYLLYRKSGKRFWVRSDFHAVPEEIGRKKEYAEIFLAEWKKRVDQAELIYTRTPEGRKMLLKARMRAMSSKFAKKSTRKNIWR